MSLLVTLAAAGGMPDPMSHVLPHLLYGHDFTNHHLMALVAAIGGFILLALIAMRMPRGGDDARSYVTRGRITQMFETICVFLRDEMTRPLLGNLTDKYIYYIWSSFFFILFGNLLGLLPIGAISGYFGGNSHIGGAFTGNLNFTGGLAIIAFIMMIGISLKENAVGFIKHMWVTPMKPLYLAPLMIVIGVFVFLLELVVSPIIRAFALAVRLFANMVAGHLVLGSLIVLALSASAVGKGASLLGAAAFSFLELFVAFLQAYIFCFLTVIFISLGAVRHDEHDEHHAGLDEGEMPGEAVNEGLTGTQTVP